MLTVPENRFASVNYKRAARFSCNTMVGGKKRDEGWLTQVITAAKNPVQMEAVAAKAPCLDEKNVPTSAGSAEPVNIPVMF